MQFFQNILKTIGNTPLVKLNRITEGIEASLLGKLEFFNPGGSVKDRIGFAMIEEAEEAGLIQAGYTLVEPTSGNTGVGLALAAAVKGYNIIFTIPDKMSKEKIDLLKAFGAKIIVTPSKVPPDHPSSYIKVAERIVKTTPNAFMPNQYFNKANPEIHYRTTGPEVWEQTDGKVSVLVSGMGTGGTITGTGRYLKERNPKVRVVGVDPEGSMYHHEFYGAKGEIHPYKVEGIGEDFMPSTLDMKVVDEIVVVEDKDAFLTARRLAREEGIFAGGSAGAATFAAVQVARKLTPSDVVVVILPDTGRNYLNKMYSDEWMMEQGFLETKEERIAVREIVEHKSRRIRKLITVGPADTLDHAVTLMRKHGISQLPAVEEGVCVGSVREISVVKKLSDRTASGRQRVEDAMEEPFPTVDIDDKILNPFELLKTKNAFLVTEKGRIIDIVTSIDVIDCLIRKEMLK